MNLISRLLYSYLFIVTLLPSLSFANAILHVDSDTQVGDVALDGAKVFVFHLKNIGTSNLKIESIKKSCGCTYALLEKEIISPSDSAKLFVLYINESIENDHQSDFFSSRLMILSNSSKNPQKVLNVEGNVIRSTIDYEKILDLSNLVGERKVGNRIINFFSEDRKQIPIKSYHAGPVYYNERAWDHPLFSFFKKNSGIHLKYNASTLAPGSYVSMLYVTLLIDHDKTKRLEIPVILKVTDPVTFSPKALNVQVSSKTSFPRSSRVLVKHIEDVNLEIQSIKLPVDWLVVSEKRKIKNNSFFIYLQINAMGKIPEDDIPIEIQFTANGKTIEVKYYVSFSIIGLAKP